MLYSKNGEKSKKFFLITKKYFKDNDKKWILYKPSGNRKIEEIINQRRQKMLWNIVNIFENIGEFKRYENIQGVLSLNYYYKIT